MVHTYVKLPIHGGARHFTCLAIASYICWERKFDFLDPTAFQYKYKTPGIPDIYIKYKRKKKDEFGTRTYDQYCTIEIETNATKASIEKKNSQFVNEAQNVELVVVPLNKYDKWKERRKENGELKDDELINLYDFISAYIPESEIQK